MASSRRKSAAIALAVIGVAGLSLASAAQLNVTSGSLAAGNTVVAACQPAATPVTTGFTNAFATGGYTTTAVTLGNVDALCAGLNVRITVTNAAGASLGEATGTAAAGATSYTLPAGISAAAITGVSVIISG